MTEVRVKLEGDGAELGAVPARDVARLMIAVEDAIRRVAAVVRGEPKITSGRYADVIEQAAQLRLVAIERGSVVPVFELAEADAGGLALEDASLGDAALERLLDAADPASQPDPYVAEALLWVADEARLGDRYQSVTFDVKGRRSASRRVRLDGPSRIRLRKYVTDRPSRPERDDAVTGTLVEADFERHTARLRTPDATAVTVSFDEAQADAIQQALREPATLRGLVTYDPKTSAATRVDLQTVTRGLILGADAYWRSLSFAELAAEQGSGDPVDPCVLYDHEATAAERDAVLEAILGTQ
jgi:hypothetical protein